MSEPEAPDGAGTAPGTASTAAPRLDGRPRARVRSWLSAVLLVVGCVLAPIAMVASFARTLLVDSDSYVATVAPLAQDPLVLAAVEDRLTERIGQSVDSLQLTDRLGAELEQLGLPSRLTTLATTLAATLRQNVDAVIDRTVHRAVSSAAFAQVWRTANLAAHAQLVATMQDESGGTAPSFTVDVGGLIATVRDDLVAQGAGWAASIPDVSVTFEIAENANVTALRGYYGVVGTLGLVLPWVACAALALSVLLARRRRAALGHAGLGMALSMVVLAAAILLGRNYLVSAASSDPDVTTAIVRQVLTDLRTAMRVVLVVALAVALLAWIFGSSRSAVALRGWTARLGGGAGDGRATALRVAAAVVAAGAGIVLVTLDDPSGGAVVALLVVAVVGAAAAAVNPTRWAGGLPPPATAADVKAGEIIEHDATASDDTASDDTAGDVPGGGDVAEESVRADRSAVPPPAPPRPSRPAGR